MREKEREQERMVKEGQGEKMESDERRRGGSGFCTRNDKFGGAAFCPRKPIAINTWYVRYAVEPPRYTLMQCIWNNL